MRRGVLLEPWRCPRRNQAGRPNPVVALVGNPNTGKSTVFNALTGLKQHTGNWPGKTVALAVGVYRHAGKEITLVDLPGVYSLSPLSPEERVARDFLCFGRPEVTVVVVDATCLERHLHLVLQVLEMTPKAIVCVNLVDEAKKKGILVDAERLGRLLGVPAVPTAARRGDGLGELKEAIAGVVDGRIPTAPVRIEYPPPIEEAVASLSSALAPLLEEGRDARWVALRLLEGDEAVLKGCRSERLPGRRVNG